MDVNNGGTANGTKVVNWEKNNNIWQEFRFHLIEKLPDENEEKFKKIFSNNFNQTKHFSRHENERRLDAHEELINRHNSKQNFFDELLKSDQEKLVQKPIQNGVYLIEACHCSKKVLDVYGGYMDENTILQIYNILNVPNQKFEVIYDYIKKGYTIKALHSNKYVSMVYSEEDVRQQSIKYDIYDRSNILWNIIETKMNNNYKIQTKYNGKFMTVKNGGTENNTHVILFNGINGLHQEFKFIPVEK